MTRENWTAFIEDSWERWLGSSGLMKYPTINRIRSQEQSHCRSPRQREDGSCWDRMRLPADCPARKAMRYYFEERTNKIFRGRRRTTIVSTLNEDIKRTKEDDITFPVTPLILQNLYTKAKNRKLWSKIVQQVVKSAYSRWSRWSMPHSDRKEKRLRNVNDYLRIL